MPSDTTNLVCYRQGKVSEGEDVDASEDSARMRLKILEGNLGTLFTVV